MATSRKRSIGVGLNNVGPACAFGYLYPCRSGSSLNIGNEASTTGGARALRENIDVDRVSASKLNRLGSGYFFCTPKMCLYSSPFNSSDEEGSII